MHFLLFSISSLKRTCILEIFCLQELIFETVNVLRLSQTSNLLAKHSQNGYWHFLMKLLYVEKYMYWPKIVTYVMSRTKLLKCCCGDFSEKLSVNRLGKSEIHCAL